MSPRFSLQNVLEFRHQKVELLEVELGKLMAARQDAELHLAALQEFHRGLLEQLGLAQSGEIDLVRMNLLRLNIAQVIGYIEKVTLELKQLARDIEAKRAQLVSAKQSEETLEILKRRRFELYAAEELQVESRAQDDIYIAQAFRKQQGV